MRNANNADVDFPTATPVERGCGSRKPGGFYLECGFGGNGSPLEHFLIDPPTPAYMGIEEIVRKPQLWQDAGGTNHVLIWVGAQFYPYVTDFIEEVRQFGASRRISHTFPLDRLSPHSNMIFIHPNALNTGWATQLSPTYCPKDISSHQHQHSPLLPLLPNPTAEVTNDNDHAQTQRPLLFPTLSEKRVGPPASGPCLGKTYNLIPTEAASEVIGRGVDALTGKVLPPLCVRQRPSFTYTYEPHETENKDEGEEARAGLAPGIFMWLPIHCVGYVRNQEETPESQKCLDSVTKRIKKGGLNFYQTDK